MALDIEHMFNRNKALTSNPCTVKNKKKKKKKGVQMFLLLMPPSEMKQKKVFNHNPSNRIRK
jgi:hypothetical protein